MLVYCNGLYLSGLLHSVKWATVLSISLELIQMKRILDSVGEGKGGMFRENSIETCILSRVKQIPSPGWMHETSARA